MLLQSSKLDIGGMLFSGILIASLGAVMDVAMSVSSCLAGNSDNSSSIFQEKDMFRSGINIGRDMIGTMSNTLILAYVGGSSESYYDYLCVFISDDYADFKSLFSSY